MSEPIARLPDDPAALKAMLAAREAEIERLHQIIKELQRHRFGRRAESLPEDQLLLGLEEAEQVEAARLAERPRRSDALGLRPATPQGRGLKTTHTLKAEIDRLRRRLDLTLELIRELDAEREAALDAMSDDAECREIAALRRIRGVGDTFAAVLVREVLYRPFANRKQLASYVGLTPMPYQSGSMDRDRRIGRAGKPPPGTTTTSEPSSLKKPESLQAIALNCRVIAGVRGAIPRRRWGVSRPDPARDAAHPPRRQKRSHKDRSRPTMPPWMQEPPRCPADDPARPPTSACRRSDPGADAPADR